MRNRATGHDEWQIRLKPGTHAALLYSDPAQLGAALGFLAEGVNHGEACACLAYTRFNERVEAQLRDLHGVDTRRALVEEKLAFMDGRQSAKLIRTELQRFFAHARKSRRPARLIASLGWGEEVWPDENELLWLDAQLNPLCEEYGVAALCLYDARQLTGALLLHGGLECHPVIVTREAIHKNPFFVPPATVQKELGQRRRDDDRLRSWIS